MGVLAYLLSPDGMDRKKGALASSKGYEDLDRARWHTYSICHICKAGEVPEPYANYMVYLMLKCIGKPLISIGTGLQGCHPLENEDYQEIT